MLAGAAVLAAALLLWPVQALTVRPARGRGLLWAAPVRPGAAFTLRWTHTVTRRPIREAYLVEPDGRIRLETMTFDQHGPNLPSGPEGGTVWHLGPDGVTVTGYTDRYDRLNLGVGPYDHHLEAAGRDFDLVAGAGPDRLIRLAVERTPRLLILLTEVWQWRNIRSQS